jgi:hypothetical protein
MKNLRIDLKFYESIIMQKNKGDATNIGFRSARLTHHLCFWRRVRKSCEYEMRQLSF